MMKIYNTLTRKKDEFIPVEEGKLKLYSCGPTVYNYFHIGNARPFLFFDVVRRYFEYIGYDVTYAQNITDIDDKLINQSIQEGIPVKKIADKYIKAFYDDLEALEIRRVDEQPKATEYIGEMIGLIKELESKGFAYESGGDVYFSVTSLPNYGKLSGKKIDDLRAGARVEANNQKKHAADFTLWKAAKPGEPKWGSPWGEGRPGWHTECVVMSRKLLDNTFDIHGGGTDLVFPHHENEIAQAEAANGKPLANYWMHNGYLNIEGEKMSKSLNNFFTTRDILKQYSAEAIRFFFLSKHYRSPIDFNESIIKESEQAVKKLHGILQSVNYFDFREEDNIDLNKGNEFRDKFREAMDDDFNTAKAIAVLFEISKLIKISDPLYKVYAKTMVELGQVLGFFHNLEDKWGNDLNETAEKLIELFIQYRQDAKKNRDWATADKIRDDLLKLGIQLKDTPSGTDWSK